MTQILYGHLFWTIFYETNSINNPNYQLKIIHEMVIHIGHFDNARFVPHNDGVGYVSAPPFRPWTIRRRTFRRRDYSALELFFLFVVL